jgi:hypothetical protein
MAPRARGLSPATDAQRAAWEGHLKQLQAPRPPPVNLCHLPPPVDLCHLRWLPVPFALPAPKRAAARRGGLTRAGCAGAGAGAAGAGGACGAGGEGGAALCMGAPRAADAARRAPLFGVGGTPVPARLRRGTRRCALYKALTLSALRAQRRLDAVGFVWEKPSQTEAWDAFYAQLLVPAPKAPPPPAAPPTPPLRRGTLRRGAGAGVPGGARARGGSAGGGAARDMGRAPAPRRPPRAPLAVPPHPPKRLNTL